MPKRELSHPHQVIDWLHEWAAKLTESAEMAPLPNWG